MWDKNAEELPLVYVMRIETRTILSRGLNEIKNVYCLMDPVNI